MRLERRAAYKKKGRCVAMLRWWRWNLRVVNRSIGSFSHLSKQSVWRLALSWGHTVIGTEIPETVLEHHVTRLGFSDHKRHVSVGIFLSLLLLGNDNDIIQSLQSTYRSGGTTTNGSIFSRNKPPVDTRCSFISATHWPRSSKYSETGLNLLGCNAFTGQRSSTSGLERSSLSRSESPSG